MLRRAIGEQGRLHERTNLKCTDAHLALFGRAAEVSLAEAAGELCSSAGSGLKIGLSLASSFTLCSSSSISRCLAFDFLRVLFHYDMSLAL